MILPAAYAHRVPLSLDGLSQRGHLREFLTAFGYMSPLLLAVAIDMHFRIEPTGVIEGAGPNKRDTGHHCEVREDWRAAVRTEVALYRLTAIALVVKRL